MDEHTSCQLFDKYGEFVTTSSIREDVNHIEMPVREDFNVSYLPNNDFEVSKIKTRMFLRTSKYRFDEEPTMDYVAVYGSLREGQYNFEKSQMKKLGTYTVQGYEMYSLGHYPAIVKGSGSIVVELMEVTPRFKARLDRMELGAGYKIKKIKLGDKTDVTLYVYDSSAKELSETSYGKVQSGDWVEGDK